jgi:hypothetical protein
MPATEDDVPKRAKRHPTGDYEVGYGRPPKKHRFKKDEPSRNPKGRPPRSSQAVDIVQQVSRMEVPNHANGGSMIGFEVPIKKLVFNAVNGDARARAQFLKMRAQFEAGRPPAPEPVWRIRRTTKFHDGVPVEVVESPYHGLPGDPIPPPPDRPRKPRRRADETYIEIFDRIADTLVAINVNGKKQRVPAEHALWLGIFADASKGDPRAMDLIIRYGNHARNQGKIKDAEEINYSLNIGNARIVNSGPKVSFRFEFLE